MDCNLRIKLIQQKMDDPIKMEFLLLTNSVVFKELTLMPAISAYSAIVPPSLCGTVFKVKILVGELYLHTWAPVSACGPLVDNCAPHPRWSL